MELFTEDEQEGEGEEKEDIPGDWALVLDVEEDPGVPKVLESSTHVDKSNTDAVQ